MKKKQELLFILLCMHQVIVYISDIYHDNVHCVSEERQSVMQSDGDCTLAPVHPRPCGS